LLSTLRNDATRALKNESTTDLPKLLYTAKAAPFESAVDTLNPVPVSSPRKRVQFELCTLETYQQLASCNHQAAESGKLLISASGAGAR
jgi:hypothetical protein